MSVRRRTSTECPDQPQVVGLDVCQPCPYFRGATYVTGRSGWEITCNWPRNGSYIAIPLDDLPAEDIRRLVVR